MSWNPTRWGKKWLSAVALAVALLFTAVPRSYAHDRDDKCERQVEKAEANLDRAVDRYGPQSRQAYHRRQQLHEARERCFERNHRWWDGRSHQWRTDHDFDRDDR